MKKVIIFLQFLSLSLMPHAQAPVSHNKTSDLSMQTSTPQPIIDIDEHTIFQGEGNSRMEAINNAIIHATLSFRKKHEVNNPLVLINYNSDIINRIRHTYGLGIEYKIIKEYMSLDKQAVDLLVEVFRVSDPENLPNPSTLGDTHKLLTIFVDKRLRVDMGELLMLVHDNRDIIYRSTSFTPTGTIIDIYSTDHGMKDLTAYIVGITDILHIINDDNINYFLKHNEISSLNPTMFEILVSHRYVFSNDLFYKYFNLDPTTVLSINKSTNGRMVFVSTYDSKELFFSKLQGALEFSIKDYQIEINDFIVTDNLLKIGYDDTFYQSIYEYTLYMYDYLKSLVALAKGYIHL